MIALPQGLFRYIAMPEIGPRIHALFMGGFGYIPYFLAVVYQMVGLLPSSHPYLYSSNIGRYGIRHVVAEAARNLTFSLKTIDQIILFIAVLAGLVIFAMQLLALVAVIFLQPASATMPTNWTEFFYISNNAYRRQDLAFMMLDMVFGVPYTDSSGTAMGFFESCIGATADACQDNFGTPVYEWETPTGATGSDMTGTGLTTAVTSEFGPFSSGSSGAFPFPYHLGLHRIFQVYSNGLLVVAVVITSYFIVTILAETMQTGVAFGRRFNKTWVPLRIVIAFGLLMPFGSGLNSSQYVVLYAAKYGSAFASNGWRYFNDLLNMGYYGNELDLVAFPNEPKIEHFTRFMFIARTCKYAHDYYADIANRQEWSATGNAGPPPPPPVVEAYILGASASGTDVLQIGTISYDNALTFLDDHVDTMVIRFGINDDERYANELNGVSTTCGQLLLPLTDPRDNGDAAPGPYRMQSFYFTLITYMWLGVWPSVGTPVESFTANRRHVNLVNTFVTGARPVPPTPDPDPTPAGRDILIDSNYVNEYNQAVKDWLASQMQTAVNEQRASPLWGDPSQNTSPLYQKGWAGAGIWYNKVSEMNGSLVAAVAAIPAVDRYPDMMEHVAEIKAKYDSDVGAGEQFKVEATDIDSIKSLMDGVSGYELAVVLWQAYNRWGVGEGGDSQQPADNPILSAISSILGLDGLYNLRENPTTHPLAMLSGIGRSLVESSIRSLGYAAVISGASVFGGKYVPKTLASLSASFFVTIAMLGLTVGFLLFYVLPFLPFMYFFFAVGGWIKGIFEAMVGAPLWALAHIRIDGHGLSGQAALNGYYLIFEVFLRPILILFGLLASISIYSALVSVLNTAFSLAVANLGGFDLETSLRDPTILSLDMMRGLVDEFFYTVMYAMVVYLLGMSSFKLIDTIPNNILRWMGQSVATFGDQRENPAEGLVSRMSVGSQQATSKIGGGLQSLVGAATK